MEVWQHVPGIAKAQAGRISCSVDWRGFRPTSRLDARNFWTFFDNPQAATATHSHPQPLKLLEKRSKVRTCSSSKSSLPAGFSLGDFNVSPGNPGSVFAPLLDRPCLRVFCLCDFNGSRVSSWEFPGTPGIPPHPPTMNPENTDYQGWKAQKFLVNSTVWFWGGAGVRIAKHGWYLANSIQFLFVSRRIL